MQEFIINTQQIDFIKQALNEGTYPFAAKNIVGLLDMLRQLPAHVKQEVEEKQV